MSHQRIRDRREGANNMPEQRIEQSNLVAITYASDTNYMGLEWMAAICPDHFEELLTVAFDNGCETECYKFDNNPRRIVRHEAPSS